MSVMQVVAAHAWAASNPLPTASQQGILRASGDPAVDGIWLPDTLPRYNRPRAVVDSAGDRLLLFEPFGGTTRVWALALDGSAPATLLDPLGTPPLDIFDAALVYDPDSARVLMYGGNVRSLFIQVRVPTDSLYQLRLRPQLEWQRLAPLNGGPAPRFRPAAVLDRVRRRMLVQSAGIETWSLPLDAPLSWVRLATSGVGPGPERFGTPFAVTDDVRARMLFGDSQNDTTWTLALAGAPTWSFVTHNGARPLTRGESAIAPDPARQKLILLGLRDSTNQVVTSASALDYATLQWSPFPAIPDPAPLEEVPTAAVDLARGVLWMAGLAEQADGVWTTPATGDATWSRVFGRGIDPGGGGLGAMWVDATTDSAYLMGVSAPGQPHDWATLWSLPLDGNAASRFYWRAESLTAGLSPARSSVAAAFDSRRRALLVFGGDFPGGGTLADLRSFDVSTRTWRAVVTTGPTPAPRAGARAVYDPATDRMYMYGGVGATTPASELWSLGLASSPPQWSLVPASQVPTGSQSGAALALDTRRQRLCLFGGLNPPTSDVWTLDPLGNPPTWSRLQTSGTPPSGRGYSAFIYDPIGDRLLVHGGADPFSSDRSDVWALSLSGTPTWSELHPDSPPPARAFHAFAYDAAHDRMLVYGDFNNVDRDLRVLQWQRDQTLPPPIAPPPARLQLTVLSNPSPAGVTLALGLVENGDVRVDLIDLTGRIAFTQLFPEVSAGPRVITVAPGMQAGIYWARVRQGAYESSARAVVLR
jgi:hypothetical protein